MEIRDWAPIELLVDKSGHPPDPEIFSPFEKVLKKRVISKPSF